MADNCAADVERKALMLQNADQQTKRLAYAADFLLAVCWEATSPTDREERLKKALTHVEYNFKDLPVEQLDAEAKQQLGRVSCPAPFHWPLEFPEVFVEREGFDAVVGNPPFMGGQKITGHFGVQYRGYLVDHVACGKKGSADVCAYFFLRAYDMLRSGGNLGLLATNTIAQGDTREVGLDRLTCNGGAIFRASPSRVWPGNAAVFVAVCHLHKGDWRGPCFLNDTEATRISALLDAEHRSLHPQKLVANADLSFKGAEVYGLGFVLTPQEVQELTSANPRNLQVVRPYLDGEAVNRTSDQSAERWVIDFTGKSEQEAAQYAECFSIVEQKVKPQRQSLASRNTSGLGRARVWWRFSREVRELYDIIRNRARVLVIARVSRTGPFVYVSPQQVLNEKLIVFTLPDTWAFSVLQSTLHIEWCWTYASTLKGDLNYSQTDCFETFPFPAKVDALQGIGEPYHEHRRQIMLCRREGLTKTYNRFHNADETADDIQKLRELHVEMDNAVAAAYGWTDLDLGHGFHETKQGVRFTISESARREVLARLLKLNHERYAEEVKQGLHDKGKKKPVSRKASTKRKQVGGHTLF